MTKIETIIFTIESLPSQNKLLEGTHTMQDINFPSFKKQFLPSFKKQVKELS